MCGIAGRVNTDPARPINRARLEAMTTAVAHRGPDADGFYVGAGVGLGHRRLSILDLATGDQPLSNEDGRFWVVFNGEIFNFADTRAELETAGHHFRTNTDTEVSSTRTRSGATQPSSDSAACSRMRSGKPDAPAAARPRSPGHQAALLRVHA